MSQPAPKTATPPSPNQLSDLLQRWEASLALHARYAALDDERYRHVQPWPKHERPARWIIRLAQQRLGALNRIVSNRSAEGDGRFLEALELMGFLSTLVGLSNVERFIPLCDGAGERREILNVAPPTEDATREMPKLPSGHIARMLLAQKAGVPYRPDGAPRISEARGVESRRAPAAKRRAVQSVASNAKPSTRPNAFKHSAATPQRPPAPQGVDALIVDDAVRLLAWGRLWHELPEIIVRLADRPPLAGVRRALREHRELIERRHGATVAGTIRPY